MTRFIDYEVNENIFVNENKTNEVENIQIKKECNVTYDTYIKNNINLNKFKIPELKTIAKKHKLHVTGTKVVLIERIENLFKSITCAIKIQKVFRGNMVRVFLNKNKEFRKVISQCVNDSDGYTLEPLNEIPFQRLFCFKDSKNFMYGFDIISLMTYYKNKGKVVNPYTRDRVDSLTVVEILAMTHLLLIVFPNVLDDSEKKAIRPNPVIAPPSRLHNNTIARNRVVPESIRNTAIHNAANNVESPHHRLIERLGMIRQRTLDQRIQDLFIEIDLLGNYTQSAWFTALEKRDMIRYFRTLCDIWAYRAQLSPETKRNICQIHDPFLNVRMPFDHHSISLDHVKESCITVMENMVYCGIDNDYKRIGTFHVLTALTVVSIPARISMMWLYESLVY
jgi:hypothetical protein